MEFHSQELAMNVVARLNGTETRKTWPNQKITADQ